MFNKLTLRDYNLRGKKVLLRADFNVPLNSNLQITSDKRIVEELPTIQYLIEEGARVIICSHLGRPEGKVMEEFSLKPVVERLRELLRIPILFAKDVAGSECFKYAGALKDGDVMVMENLRFDPGEEANDEDFAKKLASLADIYCNDAFGTIHRAHASINKVAEYLPSCAGLLVEKELTILGGALETPRRPFLVVIGGVKVKDKIALISRLIEVADILLIGGAMAYTFLRAQGLSVGKSLVERDKIPLARLLLKKAENLGVKIYLPIDHVVTGEFNFAAESITASSKKFPKSGIGMDIGPRTIALFKRQIAKAKMIFWNGTLGVSEFEKFAKGTNEIAKAISKSNAFSIVGGGDSAKAIETLSLQKKIDFVSTGGGASLKLLEGVELPGLKNISEKESPKEDK